MSSSTEETQTVNSLDGGSATTTGAPIVSGGSEPVKAHEAGPSADAHSMATDYHFVEGDLPVESTTHWAGHVSFLQDSTLLQTVLLTYTDTETIRDATSATTNIDISSLLSTGMETPAGAILYISLWLEIAGVKVQIGTDMYGIVRYSMTYDTAPDAANVILYDRILSQSLDADDQMMRIFTQRQAFVPVVYSGATPYVTVNLNALWSGMTASTGTYKASLAVYLAGLLQ